MSVLDELAATTLLRTDRNGWIELSTDGARMWVAVEKNDALETPGAK